MQKQLLTRFCLLSIILAPGVFAQEPESKPDDGEVVRVEDLSRRELDAYIIEAEDQFYEIFNAINSDDRFDIICRKETRIGSNIPVRVCPPRFLVEAMADNASNYMFDSGNFVTDQSIESDAKPELQQLQEEMAVLIKSNPQLREIAGILRLLRARREQLSR